MQLARDGYVGYLPAGCLGPADPEPTHRVTALRTFLYPEPDLKRPVLAHLSLGARLVATGAAGAYLETPGGYVFARHCAPVTAREPDHAGHGRAPPGHALSLGRPHQPRARLLGPRAALPRRRRPALPARRGHAGAGSGRPLPLDRAGPDLAGLRRGDLVFWRGHVGLMLDPETLIHANGHHMAVAAEPLAEAVARIRAHQLRRGHRPPAPVSDAGPMPASTRSNARGNRATEPARVPLPARFVGYSC